jgi:hypothetical protein
VVCARTKFAGPVSVNRTVALLLPSVVTTLLLVPLMVPGSPQFPFVRLLASVPGANSRVVEERNS